MKDIFAWIETEFKPQFCTSDKFIYDDMESQSGFSLPLIYQPFDAAVRWHWSERGCLFDFLYTTNAEGKRVLDFGPGDGWPSLIIAPSGVGCIAKAGGNLPEQRPKARYCQCRV